MARREISLQEFVDEGYLQELNRVYLHPLGLALSVNKSKTDGRVLGFGPIWDSRDDPEGIVFADVDQMMVDRSQRIAEQWQNRKITREGNLGFMVQPLTLGEQMFTPKSQTVDVPAITTKEAMGEL